MNLVEKYETLLRRGMPLHPNLGIDGDEFGLCAVADIPPDGDGIQPCLRFGYCPEPVAHDLIAMHGLRWVKTLTPNYLECVLFELKRGTDLLDAIVQLTANLEPKND